MLETPGSLVISLDFELHWGVRDGVPTHHPYRENLLGGRKAIPEILRVFEEHGVHATWATVGFLFARDRDELESFFPDQRPTYENRTLSPYGEPLGRDEADDPLHYAPSLIRKILETPDQEIGSHTLSHYYCLEAGQTEAQFATDLSMARRVAGAWGLDLTSLVLPRNQVNPGYLDTLRALGFTNFRGTALPWPYAPNQRFERVPHRRLARLIDTCLPLMGDRSYELREASSAAGLLNLRASHFLSPSRGAVFDRAQARRIQRDMDAAARGGRVFHLWWHPHNFGVRLEQNLALLREVLVGYRRLRSEHGFRSCSMAEIASTRRPT